ADVESAASQEDRWHLSRLSGTCRCLQDQPSIALHRSNDFLVEVIDRQRLALIEFAFLHLYRDRGGERENIRVALRSSDANHSSQTLPQKRTRQILPRCIICSDELDSVAPFAGHCRSARIRVESRRKRHDLRPD